MYNRLTPAEQIYIEQDGSTAADINAADVWTIIDYLTPLYGRYTAKWYELIRRLTNE